MLQADVAIVGGGLAGSTAAAMLGRAGIGAVLIDPHQRYPKDFRCEKLDAAQVRLLRRTGIADAGAAASGGATMKGRGRVSLDGSFRCETSAAPETLAPPRGLRGRRSTLLADISSLSLLGFLRTCLRSISKQSVPARPDHADRLVARCRDTIEALPHSRRSPIAFRLH